MRHNKHEIRRNTTGARLYECVKCGRRNEAAFMLRTEPCNGNRGEDRDDLRELNESDM